MLMICSSCQTAPAPDAHKRQTLRMNIHSDPPSLDPRKASDVSSISLIKICFDGLMRLDSKGDPTFALAKEVFISQDQKTYIFVLKDAYWSDGEPITASDFEETWKEMLDPAFLCEFAADLYILKNGKSAKENIFSTDEVGVKALDAKTLKIELEHPTPQFLLYTTTHSFLPTPRHIVRAFPNWADRAPENYIGSGPFVLKEWRHYNLISMQKNPLYWDQDVVQLEKIQLLIIEDENTELNMYESRELDWADHPLSNLPSDALQALAKSPEMHRYMMSGTYYYIFNTQSPPFNNVHLRRAFALVINRKEIVGNITQGEQLPATGLVPPTMWKEQIDYFQDADVKEARACFAHAFKEIGITVAELPTLTLSYNTMSSHHKITQAIQEQWLQAFGIRVKLENKEWKVFLSELSHGQFQIARLGGVANFNNPTEFLDVYRYANSSNNRARWHNEKFTHLLERAETISDAK